MDINLSTSTLAGRLASFENPVQVTKRRASSTKKKHPTTASWPHKNPTPTQLARAGFYYNPSGPYTDSVTCFLCNKALDGWEPEDNPILEHIAHVPNCGWAINACIELRSQELDRVEEDPRSMKLIEARRATFLDRWPHEGKKGWKCKVDKMVEAGWSYDPLPEADDCVKCFYCGVCLDGWEPKDDPWDEHQRRSPECHFFTLIEDAKRSTKVGKSRKPQTSRLSSASRLSTQSIMSEMTEHKLLEEPYSGFAGGDDDTVVNVNNSPTTNGTTKKPKKQSGILKVNRKTKRKVSDLPRDHEEQPLNDALVVDAIDNLAKDPAPAPKSKHAKTTKRTASQTIDHSEISTMGMSVMDTSEAISPPRKSTRTRVKKKQVETSANAIKIHTRHDGDPITATVTDARLSDRRLEVVEGEMHDSSIVVLDTTETWPSSVPREIRGKKRTSDGVAKVKVLRASRPDPSRPLGQAPIPDSVGDVPPVKKVRNLQKALPDIPGPGSTEDKGLGMSQGLSQEQDMGSSLVEIGIGQGFDALRHTAQAQETRENDDEMPLAPDQALAPTFSQQSSDAENRPPSSRPSFVNLKVSEHFGTPGRAMEQMVTPAASPSRPNAMQELSLKSITPWDDVDLETILLPSPSARHIQKGTQQTSLEAVLSGLSSAEKKMNVQEWILWNARQAEDGLKGECERLINIFEREGMRALGVLEGVECL